jgi:hypothetical protein
MAGVARGVVNRPIEELSEEETLCVSQHLTEVPIGNSFAACIAPVHKLEFRERLRL